MTQDIYLTAKDLEEANCGLTINVNEANETNINIGKCCVDFEKMADDYYHQEVPNIVGKSNYDIIMDAYMAGALKVSEVTTSTGVFCLNNDIKYVG